MAAIVGIGTVAGDGGDRRDRELSLVMAAVVGIGTVAGDGGDRRSSADTTNTINSPQAEP